MKIERLVLDTNVAVSAALDDESTAARVIDLAVESCQLIGTGDTVKEIVETLYRPKFDRYISPSGRELFLSRLERFTDIVAVIQRVKACQDPRDDKFLEAALNGRADAIVSGAKDLLTLNPFRGILILTPAQYLQHAKTRDR